MAFYALCTFFVEKESFFPESIFPTGKKLPILLFYPQSYATHRA
jgi:hypothetical protein